MAQWVAIGRNNESQCNVSGWHDIAAVAAGYLHSIGLKSDGTVAAAAGCAHTIGLRSDGTVVAVGDNEYGQCDVSGWHGIQLPAI